MNWAVTILRLTRPSSGELDSVRNLFREYADWLGVDLCFQGFEQELATLPGCYAEPRGAIWLASDGDEVAGCVAVRPISDEVCELKRLWVRPDYRGRGLGAELTNAALEFARAAGYRRMVLDTLENMQEAVRLYERLGFARCQAYYDNPLPSVVYLQREI